MNRFSRLVITAAFACCAAQAALTTVTASYVDAGGNALTGSCSIQAVAQWTAATGGRVVGVPYTVAFSSGAFSAALVPTDVSGQYYRTTCQGHNSAGVPKSWGPEIWQVPTISATWGSLGSQLWSSLTGTWGSMFSIAGSVDISAVVVSTTPATPISINTNLLIAPGRAPGRYCLNVGANGVITLGPC